MVPLLITLDIALANTTIINLGDFMKRKAIYFSTCAVLLTAFLLCWFYDEIPFLQDSIEKYKIDRFQQKIRKDPYSTKLHYELAQLYLSQGDLDKYEEKLRLLSKLSKDSYLFPEKLGDHYFKTEQYERAINAYKEALSLYVGKDILLHFRIGNAYANLNEKQKAIDEYMIQLRILENMSEETKRRKMIEFIRRIVRSLRENR